MWFGSIFKQLEESGLLRSPAIDEFAERYPNRVPLKDAIQMFAFPEEWARLEQLKRSSSSSGSDCDRDEVRELESSLADRFKRLELETGRRVAIGLVPPIELRSKFEIVSMTAWRFLTIDPNDWSASGEGMNLVHIEIVIPRERELRTVAPSPAQEFTHNEDYSKVSVRGIDFELSAIPANVVRLLDEARRAGKPVMDAKELLSKAGSESTDVSDHFKRFPSWRELIGMEGRGRYRLNVVSRENSSVVPD